MGEKMFLINKKQVKLFQIYAIILTVGFLFMLSSCASDIPGSNRFYKSHEKDCITCGRSFTVTGNGAEIFIKPDGKKLDRADAGNIITVDYYYTDGDGVVWGYIRTPDEGWINMVGLELVYDDIAFVDDHSGEINDASSNALPDGPRYLWSYPCSGVIVGTDASPEEEINITMKYSDTSGRTWVYLDGSGWICLDAPYDTDIAAVDYGKAVITYVLPVREPGYWDTVPAYAPYVWAGIVIIFLIEATIQVRAFIRNKTK